MPAPEAISLGNIPGYIAAVGALGVAAFGTVEAFGKSLFIFDQPKDDRRRPFGLPYAGFSKVQALIDPLGPALEASYGAGYRRLLVQQYRAGRGSGPAPETIRQGVRLGLPFLEPARAEGVIGALWGLPPAQTALLAAALTGIVADGAAPTDSEREAQALAGRFATSLDARVKAAFDYAEEVYESRAQLWAGLVAVGLSLGYQGAVKGWNSSPQEWAIAAAIGLVAVPLAPAAKDLSSSLSDALTSLGQLRGLAK